MANERPALLLFTFDAGGGHRATANALTAAAEQRGSAFRFEVVSLQDVLAPIDPYRRLTGRPLEQRYNDMVRRRQTRYLVPLLRGLQWLVRRLQARLARRVAEEISRCQPAAVLSVIPNFNGVLADAVRQSRPRVRFFVLLTDFADFPPHFWLEPGLDSAIVPTDHAVRQALDVGLPSDRIFRISGLVLHPRFYPRPPAERRAVLRRAMGIGDDQPVVLVIFGGKGSPEMRPLCEEMLSAREGWTVVAVCGDNPPLFQAVSALSARAGNRLRALPFTDGIADLMTAADLLVTKPGPGCLAEAFHLRIPAVVCGDARTIPQERYNVRMLTERGLGVAVRRWGDVPAAAAALARDVDRRSAMRRAMAELPENRGVYEVIELFERMLSAPSASETATISDLRPGAPSATPASTSLT